MSETNKKINVFRDKQLPVLDQVTFPDFVQLTCDQFENQILENKVHQVIDLDVDLYHKLKSQNVSSPVDVFQVGVADAALCLNGTYVFKNIFARTVASIIKEMKIAIDISRVAVIVGDEITVANIFSVLNQIGFDHFLVYTPVADSVLKQTQLIQKSFFGVQFEILPIDSLSKVDPVCSFLAVDYNFSEQPEVLNNLMYFSFLIPGSVVVDFRSHLSEAMLAEAKRVEFSTISSNQIYSKRYALAKEILNSSESH